MKANVKMFTLYLAFLLLAISDSQISANVSDNPIVELPLGKVEGTLRKSVNGKQYFSFEGVPYARPPTGQHRFREPSNLKPWSHVLKANTVYQCLQYRHLNEPTPQNPIVVGNEDCLYLNIYSPNLSKDANLNVIVYIHGGAFMFNWGAFHGPGVLLNHDIVYVSLNYRLGPIGFLSTEDDVVPGNNGLKDQIAALRWIQENIAYFGGNPRSVTITGNSAGGASVHLHYMIKQSTGLFHRGISQSGTALTPWVIMENPLEKTKKIASLIGCPSEQNLEMIECMRTKDGRQIVETVKEFQPWLYNPFSPFAVVVDTWASKPLLQEHPYQLLKKNLLYSGPWLASHVSSEGLYPAAEFYTKSSYLNDIDTKWDEVVPFILQYNETVDQNHMLEVNKQIREFYFGDDKISKKTYSQLVQAVSDRLYVVDIQKSVKLHASTSSPVHMYYFKYRGVNSRSISRTNSKNNFGAAHGDDISYIMQMKLDTLSTESDRNMSDILVNMWLSMANTGTPVAPIEWAPVKDKLVYLNIAGPENLIIDDRELGHPDFWNSLPFKENEKLFKDDIDEKCS